MNNHVITISAFAIMLAVGVVVTLVIFLPQVEAATGADRRCPCLKAPIATSGNNIYIAWWTNKTGNDEVMFRVSTDGGLTFGEKINLSNTTNADSQEVEIGTFGVNKDKVIVTWWEVNQTHNEPVFRISTDNGKTFEPTLELSTDGPLNNNNNSSAGR